MEIALKYKVKQSKNGKSLSNYKASSIDFETQIYLHRKAPPNISPSKRAFEKYKLRGLFSEFYGNLFVLNYWFTLLQKQKLQGSKKRGCFLFQDQSGLIEIKAKLFQYRERLSGLRAGQTFQECLKKEDFMLTVRKMNLFHLCSKSSLYITLQKENPDYGIRKIFT